MKQRLLLLAIALAACKPAVSGRCTSNDECNTAAGVFCDERTNICIAASGTCSPACGQGQLCSQGACTDLKPVLTVELQPTALLSPAFSTVKVSVSASPALALHGLAVEVDAASNKVASGSIDAAVNGENTVALTQIQAGAVGAVSVTAILTYGNGETVRSVAVPATLDAAAPSVTLSISPSGWVAREGDPMTVTAHADDGAGSGVVSASLTFDGCDACAAIQGTLSGNDFSFQVPRSVQTAGSEVAVAFTVTVADRAGNQAAKGGSLQIDDAPPHIGRTGTVVAGVTSEDGTSPWFSNGSPVEIVVPVSDSGSGFASMTLAINPADVPAATNLAPSPTAPGDGTVHFILPADVYVGEGALRFTLTAKDVLQHTATKQDAIYVDAVPPVITQPQVDYADAMPGLATVCNDTESSTFNCGRRVGTALLRDDSAQVSFDVIDCGAGLSNSTARISAAVGGTTKTVSTNGKSAGACANGSNNSIHHYTFTMNAGTDVQSLGAADDTGLASVVLSASAGDKTLNAQTRGDGLAAVSLWRWKRKLSTSITAAPALLQAASAGAARQVAAGTAPDSSNNNGFVVAPDGSQAQAVDLFGPSPAGDLVVGPGGTIFAWNGSNRIGLFAGGVDVCGGTGSTNLGTPVVTAVAGKDTAYVLASNNGSTNFFTYTWDGTSCNSASATLGVPGGGGFTGASLGNGLLFGSHAQGFSSYDLTHSNAQVNTFDTFPAPGAPSLLSGTPFYLTSDASDHTVHRTKQGNCTVLSVLGTCWNDDGTAFTAANAALQSTPVFDTSAVWAADNAGGLYRWALAGGTPQTATLTAASTPPVLLQDGSALVVQKDGPVMIVSSSMTALKLVNLGSFSGAPLTPVIDTRGSFGVAYVPAPSGWLYALQTPSPPTAAGSNTWPRPGRDSCNSRNAGSTCP